MIHVWSYHRAECDRCKWEGSLHLPPSAAAEEADVHHAAHVAAQEREVSAFREALDAVEHHHLQEP